MYRAKAITQRDGTKLANQNCRMASIACGLDFDTLGAKKSTGGKMRTFTADQSGGTDSGDAREAWSKGYKETLTVRDGNGWGQVLVDLKAGRLVHLDVWHALLKGSPACVSGEGRYGHTIAVAPEQAADGKWLVSDPWCLPAKWVWVSEKVLRLAAEDWGSRVFNESTRGRHVPMPELGSDALGLILAAMGRRLMAQFYPENEATPSAIPPVDTGGPPPVLYTTTMAHPDGGSGGGDDVVMQVIQSRPSLMDAAAGVDFYDSPGGARIGEMSKAGTVEIVGVPMDASSDHLNLGWRAGIVSTQAIDGVTYPKVVYFATNTLTNQRPIPTPTPPPSGDEYIPVGELFVKKV